MFKGHRADVAVGALPCGSVVVHFNILEYGPTHVLTCGETLAVDHLHLESVEETLGAGIVIAIALAAHTGGQVVLGHEGLILL